MYHDTILYNVVKGVSFNNVIKTQAERKKRTLTGRIGSHWVATEKKGDNNLEFYDFAIRLRPFVPKGGTADHTYVKSLFENITDIDLLDDKDNPFTGDNSLSDDSWRGYIKTTSSSRRSIKEVAKRINEKLDTKKFDEYIYENVTDEKLGELRTVFQGIIPECRTDEVSTELAKLFAKIIRTAATKKRKSPTTKSVIARQENTPSTIFDNEEVFLLSEVNNRCPITGKALLKNRGGNLAKVYGIVYIYPKNIDLLVQQEFSSIEAPENIDSLDNKIALSLEHASIYAQAPTVDMYNKLKEIKRKISLQRNAYDCVSSLEIEDNIKIILDNIQSLQGKPKSAVNTKWDAFMVDDKIKNDYVLNDEVTGKVLQYYRYINEKLGEIEGVNGFRFNHLKSTIHQCYEECANANMSQSETFDFLSDWISLETGCMHIPTCRTFISFFVQNCEVFDVTTE